MFKFLDTIFSNNRHSGSPLCCARNDGHCKALSQKYLIIVAPGKARKWGWRVPETLQQNPVGKQSHPVNVSHQPEASLA